METPTINNERQKRLMGESLINIINIKTIESPTGGFLSFFQSPDLGFQISRIYYIYSIKKNTKRGFHAHKSLRQFAWCPYGDITFNLDDGYSRKEVRLNHPFDGLLIEIGIWHEMIWNKKNSVLCVAASDYYKESDYIRDYDEFLRLVKEGFWDELDDEYKI
jgi:dTDP-4-dehydrorhamnose 3,5-epimerase-like enzyme